MSSCSALFLEVALLVGKTKPWGLVSAMVLIGDRNLGLSLGLGGVWQKLKREEDEGGGDCG